MRRPRALWQGPEGAGLLRDRAEGELAAAGRRAEWGWERYGGRGGVPGVVPLPAVSAR